MHFFLGTPIAAAIRYAVDAAFASGRCSGSSASLSRSMATISGFLQGKTSTRRHAGTRPQAEWRRLSALPAIAVLGSLICACSQPEATSAEVGACAAKLFADYDPKNLDQCVAVCVGCMKGTRATCSTSCNLKGAR